MALFRFCAVCDLPLGATRRERFCSNACRQSAYRARKARGETARASPRTPGSGGDRQRPVGQARPGDSGATADAAPGPAVPTERARFDFIASLIG